MRTRRNAMNALATFARAMIVAVMFAGPLAGFAAAQDDGERKFSGAGFVLYVSLLRG